MLHFSPMNTSKEEMTQTGSLCTFGSSKVPISRTRAVVGTLLCAHAVDNPYYGPLSIWALQVPN